MDWTKINWGELVFKCIVIHLAPFHFTPPKNCPIEDKLNCDIWNCEEHYFNGKYCHCRRN